MGKRKREDYWYKNEQEDWQEQKPEDWQEQKPEGGGLSFLLIICLMAYVFLTRAVVSIMAYLGLLIVISIDFISSLFGVIGINNPVVAWFFLGCLVGGNIGLIKSAKASKINLNSAGLIIVAIAYNLTLLLLGYNSNWLIGSLELTEWYATQLPTITIAINVIYHFMIIIYISLCWYKIARKLDTPLSGLVAIPVIGIFYFIYYHGFNAAVKTLFISGSILMIATSIMFAPIAPLFLGLLFLLFIGFIPACFKIIDYLNKPRYFALLMLLMLVPLVNLLLLGYLAFE